MYGSNTKNDLKDLNNRIQSYLRQMRQTRVGQTHTDASTFFRSLDAMEQETVNLKTLYDREIEQLHCQLNDMIRQRNYYQVQSDQQDKANQDIKARLVVEVDKSNRLMTDLSAVQQSLLRKEQELQTAIEQTLASQAQPGSETLQKMEQTFHHNMELKRKYDAENVLRKDFEEKYYQLERKMNFNMEVSAQKEVDMQNRLAAAKLAILNLEGRVRMLDRPEHEQQVAEMLASVRDAADRELYKYQQESESAHGHNINALSAQMDADRIAFEAVTSENRKLVGVIEELNTKIRNLQGELIHMEHGKRSAEENLVFERDRATRHVQAIETKLKEVQDLLFDKMRELHEARALNLPLQSEIGSLRALIAEEEKRLAMEMRLPTISHSLPQSNTLPPSNDVKNGYHGIAPSPLHDYSAVSTPTRGVSQYSRTEPVSRSVPPSQRAQSAPAYGNSSLSPDGKAGGRAAHALGKGKDYFQELFKEGEGHIQLAHKLHQAHEAHEYSYGTQSAIGDIKIHEVHQEGKSITLHNKSKTKDVNFGGYILQQNVGGNPAAMFRFPPRLVFKANSYITVYSGSNDFILHQPPAQFVWKEQLRWGTGPECTTILCKPNGQAVAWTTAAHRFGAVQFTDRTAESGDTGNEFGSEQEERHHEPAQELHANPALLEPEGESRNVAVERMKVESVLAVAENESTRAQTLSEPYKGSGPRMGSAPLRRAPNIAPMSPAASNTRLQPLEGKILSPFASPKLQDYNQALNSKNTNLASIHFAS